MQTSGGLNGAVIVALCVLPAGGAHGRLGSNLWEVFFSPASLEKKKIEIDF